MSKTQAMCVVCPECGGKVGTCPDAGDYYASIRISEFSLQCPMRLMHRTQIKSVADVPKTKGFSIDQNSFLAFYTLPYPQ